MKRAVESDLFKTPPSRRDAKGDTTTRLAREILDGEAAVRAAKTARLRAARLAQEAATPLPVASSPRKRAKKAPKTA